MKKIFAVISLFISFAVFAEGKVIVEMDGVTFTDTELLAAVADQDPRYKEALQHDPDALNNFLKRLFVSRLVAEKYKAELLKDKNVDIALKLSHERTIHDMVIKKQYLKKIKDIDFNKLAETEYAANAEKYKTSFSLDFYHILFLKHNNLSDIDPKKKADEVLADIKAGKVTMAEMAKKYQMPLAGGDENGLLQKATLSKLMPEVSNVLKKQKINDISDVIETNMGYHIVSLHAVHKPKSIEYHEPIKAQIISGLEKELQSNVISEVALPYNNIDSYTLHEDALKAVFDKILAGQ